MRVRKYAHKLIDRLPESQLSALVGFLETIVDPVTAALRNAKIDDEPETAKEKQHLAKAHDWIKRNGGKGIPHEEAMRRLGLSLTECASRLQGSAPIRKTIPLVILPVRNTRKAHHHAALIQEYRTTQTRSQKSSPTKQTI
jgi:hypothetical protein